MRLFRIGVTTFGGLVLSVSLATTSAVAAGGHFIWEGPKGKIYSVQNPPDRKCLDMGQEARAPHNETKKPLVVYSGKKCKGAATRLGPGQHGARGLTFSSVVFNP
ncbi:hypothetical protein [Streptomyces syringium]|uniref:Uncharacterized protein n=1 Tax=Streptomyces syringium TaxID=76729 RepID=A0ABS4XVL5_9ACTN|nr:hypothetical protein [Streptomyces syringium]MBP2400551.1 hypothetical protein [Streptomyces syringium]